MNPRSMPVPLILTILLACAPSALAQPADVLLVDDTATGMDDGSTWLDAFVNLQDALAEADARNTDGDGSNDISEIWVAEGTYWPDLGAGITPGDTAATFQLLNNVAIHGGFSGGETLLGQRNSNPVTNNTVLSGDLNGDDDGLGGFRTDNSSHVVTCTGTDNTALITGFTVENGGLSIYALTSGGGMSIQDGSPTINLCRFRNNRGRAGGAFAVFAGGSPAFSNCAFIDNLGLNGGAGGVLGGSPTLTNCLIEQCSADQDGGAFFVETGGDLTLRGCAIRNNETFGLSTADGGGLSLSAAGDVFISDCRFEGNTTTGNGGGAQIIDSTATFINCEFIGNHADSNGGGVNAGGSAGSTVTMINCRVAGNDIDGARGGGIGSGGSGGAAYTIINSTIANNDAPGGEGGGIGLGSGGSATIANSIVYGNTDLASSTAVAQIFETTALSATVDYSNVAGGVWAGTGNISVPPGFVNPGADNYRLTAASPCINAGDDASVPADGKDLDNDADTAESVPVDLDGAYRFRNGAVDMGAYESDFCPTDNNGMDGTDINDLLALLARWGACGAPCHPDTDGDGDVDINDLLALLAAWGACP